MSDSASGNIKSWLTTEDRALAAWTLSRHMPASGRARSGNRAKDVGIGITSGKALAAVDNKQTWGGLDYLACDAFPARLDPRTGEIFAAEGYDDADTPGVAPWLLKGAKKNIRRAKGIEGVVARGNQVGGNYARAHVWLRNGELVAHHRKTADSAEPPLNSTPVHDPGEGNDDWEAGLHGIMRVRAFPSAFCGGGDDKGTAPPDKEQPDTFRALLLNFTKSAGDNSGWGSATFSDREGLLSYEAFGPLTYGAPKHRVGDAEGRETRQGAIDCDRALFGDRSDAFTAPLLFEKTEWKRGGGRFITAAYIRMDSADTHQGMCGPKKGKWKPESRCHWNSPRTNPRVPEYDDPPPIDEDPKPKKPITGPKDFVNPTIDTPDHRLEDSTIDTPDEIQIPSEYGHAKPNLPEADEGALGEPGDDDPEGMSATHGYTYEQALRSNVVSHEVFIPQYLYSTAREGAGADPNARWPQKTSRPAQVTIDPSTGRVDSYLRGYGPGSKVKLPGNAKAWHALADLKERWPSSFDEHGYLIGAGKNAAGVEMAGWLGLGLRVKTSLKPASGAYIKLDYTDDVALPDVDIRTTDADGLDASTGRKLMFNGTELASSATVVTAAGTLTADKIVVGDGTKTAKTTPVTIDPANGDTWGVGTLASGAHTIDTASTNAVARAVGENATTGPWVDEYPVEFLVSSSSATFDIPTTTDSAYIVTLDLAFLRNNAGTPRSGAIYEKALWQNGGGTVTGRGSIIGPTTIDPDALGVTAVLSASGTNIRLTVTDGTGGTIRVRGTVTVSLCGNGA